MSVDYACKPILSIVIPTRNRFQYVTHAIKGILKIDDDGFELVVHDTSDTRELESYLTDNVSDTRLRYYYSDPPLTFSETFNKSVLLSSGEYVCIIGDDDGVNPEIILAARWAKEQNIDAITPLVTIPYFWPDFRFKYYKDADAGCLKVPKFSGAVFISEVENEMLNCAKGAFQDFSFLPKIYNGIVSRRCLDEVHQAAGAIFFGSSPDISGALAVASYVKCLCVIDYPLVVAGNSAKSGSGRSAMKRHVGRLEDEPQTKPFCNDWPDNVPAFYSVQTVWAQAAIEGLKATGRSDLLEHYDSTLLQALCMVYNPKFTQVVLTNFLNSLSNKQSNIIVETYLLLKYIIANYSKRAKSHFSRFTKSSCFNYDHESTNLDTIDQATDKFINYLLDKKITFRQVQDKFDMLLK